MPLAPYPPNRVVLIGTTAGGAATYDDPLVFYDHEGLDFDGRAYPDPPRIYPLPVGHNSVEEV